MKRYVIALHIVSWTVIAGIITAQIWGPLPFWPALFAALAIRVVDMEYTMVIKAETKEETAP